MVENDWASCLVAVIDDNDVMPIIHYDSYSRYYRQS
jgi:hypothetical protein